MGKTLIIGAGAAGLYAGHLLEQAGLPYRLFEAQPKYGGRMRCLDGFMDTPLPLGAEEIHGQRSLPARLAQKLGLPTKRWKGRDYFYLEEQLQDEKQLRPNRYFRQAQRFTDKLYRSAKEPYRSVQDFVEAEGFPLPFQQLLEAWIGNEYGSENSRIGLPEVAEMEANWSVGERNFYFEKDSHLGLFEKAFPEVFQHIQLNTPIKAVEYGSANPTIVDAAGKRYVGQQVLITVPLPILQKQAIAFSPPLPEAKQQALGRLKMGAGIKVFLRFQRSFWPKDMDTVIVPGPVPEFWPALQEGAAPLLTGLVHGQAAERLSLASEEQALAAILQQLRTAFGSEVNNLLIDYHFMDWSRDPYVQGSYSYPSPGEGNARQILTQPVGQQLFFAGEACNTYGHIATVHGAMESAAAAVEYILKKERPS